MNYQTFVPLHVVSRRLGLPAAWIKAEAEAGRIPCLRTVQRLMFNLDEVESVFVERAKAGTAVSDSKKEVERG